MNEYFLEQYDDYAFEQEIIIKGDSSDDYDLFRDKLENLCQEFGFEVSGL